MRPQSRRFAAAAALAQAALFSFSLSTAQAAVPSQLTEQGRLFDNTGNPLNATVLLTFSIYATASGGSALWTETQPSVTVDQGYFSAELGSVTPIPQSIWTGATMYCGVAVNADPEMTPRQPTASVPYALVANDAVNPTGVSVNGALVINASGSWVGSPTGLVGATGPAGANGANGAQGAAGATGVVGAQGATGLAGSAGAQGPQGPIGAAGAQGAAGANGSNGAQGPAGASGAEGATGAQGAQGPAGANGAAGATGTPGATGALGPAGPQGPVGATGATGATGAAGVSGAQGAAGASGAAGVDGATGATGAEGAQGATGPTGAVGAAGSAGPMGPAGPAGATGAQGAAGGTGASGADGVEGAQGTAGSNGADGASGAQGAAGSNGATGADGATGATGPTGAMGAMGPTGPMGPAGPAGANGVQGAAGPNGGTGAQGTAGSNGSNGAQGATGSNGSNGAQGATGTAGSNGAQGAAGTAGSNGAQGAAGTAGSNGAQGAAGTAGSAGAQGATGTPGAQGAIGPAGPAGGSGSQTVVTLTDAPTIAVNASLGQVFDVTLGGNRTMGNPTGLANGGDYIFRLHQDGTGGRLIAWGSVFAFSRYTSPPTLSSSPGGLDVLLFHSDGTNLYFLSAYSSPLSVTLPPVTSTLYIVSTNGNDATGTGTPANPFATLAKAVSAASSGAFIEILAGTYRMTPQLTANGTDCIYDGNKSLTIFGAADLGTVLQCYSSDSSGSNRDNHAIQIQNGSQFSNAYVQFSPNRSTNYENAISGWTGTTATIRNVYFENISGSVNWSYNYDNNNSGPIFIDCAFNSHGLTTADYSGSPTFTNILWDVADTTGTSSFTVQRSLTSADLSGETAPADLIHTGSTSISNPDGTRSNIGVVGGTYAWP